MEAKSLYNVAMLLFFAIVCFSAGVNAIKEESVIHLVNCPYQDEPPCSKLYCGSGGYGILMMCHRYVAPKCEQVKMVKEGCMMTGVQKKKGEYPHCCPDFRKVCKGDKYFDENEFEEFQRSTHNDITDC